ncbi:hypothetical protein [Flammeovirga kamogawensis]|uniref:Cytochrome b561 bacterial/Ni-hydrogenase domain-containing protein n=1 Tax=Flammeovirga kamogawensis TaxID=373891 RepID=A0ABX8H3T8_9BACT|nr:hypothetical protein [Flammeovirga kamogawensis]MBB6463107.1 hypothetical protein [Flammeovirga kamogawensis]QWG10343.1 hypothetical protein KM029_25545 [Flammeovirga kamogawensis]TRX63852.1 hypothetical protein EO216_25915 [Flammeovirga kamogawensis]
MNKLIYFYIGSTLFILFVLQDALQLRWEGLYQLQEDQFYRRWSGLGLLFIILFQWTLSIVRSVEKWQAKSIAFYKVHNWLGALTPLLFYLHSMELGFAYLFILSITFFSNFLMGMFNFDVIKTTSKLFFQGWMIVHVSLSLLITTLTFYHIWVVFYYE